jgi:hypothetical protein
LYRKTPLEIEEFETIFEPSAFDIDINSIGNISIKSKTALNEDNAGCLMLRDIGVSIHIVKLNKCTEGGKNLLNKLIHLVNKYDKKLFIDVDDSKISFNFGEKDFGEHGTVKLQFQYTLIDIYLQSYGMTWYNSLGFVDKNFDKNHAFFVTKFGKDFEENKENIIRMRKILNKGNDMTYDEYIFLKELETKFNLPNDEYDEKYYKITHNLIYDPKRVMKGGRRIKKTKKHTKKKYQNIDFTTFNIV